MKKTLQEGQKVHLNTEALYNMDCDLSYGTIVPEYCFYDTFYDLYNKDGDLACLNKEDVIVLKIWDDKISFKNDNGDKAVYFDLTLEEADVAVY